MRAEQVLVEGAGEWAGMQVYLMSGFVGPHAPLPLRWTSDPPTRRGEDYRHTQNSSRSADRSVDAVWPNKG